MRLHLLLLGIVAGLWFTGDFSPSAAAAATARPTPTIKACHICDEEIIPVATPTATAESAPQDEPVVRAVMFWMDTCPHCHVVIDEVLPPLQQKYGDQLQVHLIEVNSEETWNQMVQVATALEFSSGRLGVPFLVIGDKALIGSGQIPDELPGLIEQHLAAGGLDYPDIPALAPLLPPAAPAVEEITPQPTATPTVDSSSQAETEEPVQASPTFTPAPAVQLITNPPASATPDGFELAIGLMVGMVIALFYTVIAAVWELKNNSAPTRPLPAWLDWAIPVLSLIGLGVAGYLAYVETQPVLAVCGPVGDCNAVQNSPYATLFGVLPVGVLGAAGYICILAAWLWWRFGPGPLADYMPLAIFGMTFLGVLFSLYLTYLEPFVIKAVCMWCLTSAVLITLLMLLSLNPALQTIRVVQAGKRKV